MGTNAERARLFDALLEEVADKGYEETALSGALSRAGLDQNGYLVEFVDTSRALHAAFEAAMGRLREEAIAGGNAREERWAQRVAAGLQAVLHDLSASQGRAEALTAVLPGTDVEVHARYQRFVEGLAPLLRAGRECSEVGDELPAEVEALAVGAAEAIIRDEIIAGHAEDLPAMGPQILFSLLVPFIGPGAAADEVDAARPIFGVNVEVA